MKYDRWLAKHQPFHWFAEFYEIIHGKGGFDVVIGNPPYIPLEAFGTSVKEYFKQKYAHFERKYETSVLFFVHAFNILNFKGLLSMIAPGTWQTGENYSKFRNFLVNKKGINLIINLPFNIFEDAYIDTSIYIIDNQPRDKYKILNFNKKEIITDLRSLNFAEITLSKIQPPKYKLILDNDAFNLFTKYKDDNYLSLGEITKSTQGLAGSKFLIAKDDVLSDYLFPFLTKGNVYNYILLKENIIQTDLSNRKSLIPFYEAEPKVLIRRIINRQNRLSVGYTEERLVFKKDINPFICTDKRFSTKFLLGLLASNFISFLYIKLSSIALKDDFRQTTLGELRNLPIPLIDNIKQKPLIELVDKILITKKSNPAADTGFLEADIDRLVYDLYGLTEEEIRIVETSL